MCRLYGFRANEPTKVECSLVHAQNALMLQSRADMSGHRHADGWGLASYRNGELCVEHRDTAAFEDLHFSSVAERIYATTVIAHVRRATVGGASSANTHPFRYRRWIFAHNGTVTAFDRLEHELAAETDPRFQALRRGTTDSERAFYWILTRMQESGLDLDSASIDARRLSEVLGEATRALDERARRIDPSQEPKLNFLLTNGSVLVASRWERTLHWLERLGIRDCEICGIPHVHHDEETPYRAVVVASEPITQEAWQEVGNRRVLCVGEDLEAELLRID